MTYDFHGVWETKTGFCAPLFDRNNDRLSVSSAMTYWSTNQGFPKEKLVVGFAAYGRGWTGPSSTALTAIGSSAEGPSGPQTFTREKGVASYYEICSMIESGQYQAQYDSAQRAPFVYKDNVWIGYDDVRSFNEKLDWLVSNGYGGAFVWSLDMDDFLGRCRSSAGVKYPLISTIRMKLEGGQAEQLVTQSAPANISPPSTPKFTTTVSPVSTASNESALPSIPTPSGFSASSIIPSQSGPTPSGPPPSESGPFKCPEAGLFPDPTSCTSFIQCDDSGTVYKLNCPAGLHFSKESLVCDWPNAAGCDNSKAKSDTA